MFKCRRVRERLVDYVEGALADRVKRETVRHIESCSACREELKAIRLSREALLSVRRSPCAEGVWARVSARLDTIERESSRVWRLLSRPAYACAACLVLVVMGAASLSFSPAGFAPPAVSAIISPLSPVGVSVEVER